PFMENNSRALQTPAKAPGKVFLTYDGMTGGYGYNYRYLAPLRPLPDGTDAWTPVKLEQVASTSQTVCFANAVGTTANLNGTGQPGLVEVALAEPPSQHNPTVHFRLSGRLANVLFLDGHVEARTDPTRNPPLSTDPPWLTQLRDQENVFDLGSTDEL